MASSLAGLRISPCAIVALQGGLIVMSPTVGRALRTILQPPLQSHGLLLLLL